MRKLLPTVVASCALVAVVPATALAHGRHHFRGHVHHRDFGSTSTGANAGTVQSFTGGVLTIALSNGSTVSGTVTSDTRIWCQAPDTSGSDTSGSDTSGWQGHDSGGQGDDQGQGDHEHAGGSCSSSALTDGTAVQAAELTVSSAGAVWKDVVLATSSATAPSPSSSSSGTSESGNH